MKNSLTLLAVAVASFTVSSCSNYGPNTNAGMATGGLLGAGAGAIIGHQSGHTGEGALIGGAAGAAAGGLYGNSMDQRNQGY